MIRPAESVSMWAASASNASEPESSPPIDLDDEHRRRDGQDDGQPPAVTPGAGQPVRRVTVIGPHRTSADSGSLNGSSPPDERH